MNKIFISYSHKDEKFKNQLVNHILPLRAKFELEIWDDGKILPGENWDNSIKNKLNNANIILLLVSSDAIASDYINNIEIAKALERNSRNEARVIPIILRPCIWTILPIAQNQALPKLGKPVTKWEDKDEAYLDIVNGLSKILDTSILKKTNNEVVHKITILTGLTSSGKDTLLIYIFDELIKLGRHFHFMNKVITRTPRAEETVLESPLNERSTVPYYVVKVNREVLEENANQKYFNVFYKYGNYTGFDKSELVDILSTKQAKHIIYINSDITNIEEHKEELDTICKNIKNDFGVKILTQTILLDSDISTCKKRLKARGLDDKARKRKYAEIENDNEKVIELKQNNFFNYIVNNNNDEAINKSMPELIKILK